MEKSKQNLGDQLESILEEMLKRKNIELTKSDMKQIVSEVLPDIDYLISQKVKLHFRQIGEFLMKNCQ